MKRLRSLVIKEWLQVLRDPSSLLILFVMPALLLFIYGYGVSLDYKNLRIGLVLEETSPDAQTFAKALADSRYFSVVIERDRHLLEEALVRGEIKGMVVIPSWFSSFRQKPSHVAPIQVIADGSDTNTANFVQNYVNAALQIWLHEEGFAHSPAATLEPRFWFNESLESRFFLVPGSIALIMTVVGTLLTSLVVAREWERGTMEALLATPVTIYELVSSKFLSYFLLGFASFLFSTLAAILLFHVPLRGSIFLLCLTGSLFLITALGTGLLISVIAKNQFVASEAALIVAFLPAFILSGFLFEISSMPLLIRWITVLVPARYFVSSLQTLFLAGNVPLLLVRDLLILAGIGALLFFFIAKKTTKRLE
ncbi:MAG: ABC transporter permease [Verrucomicrobiota bacterium]|nr:ABC transporter permease [Verrucomicrobiota bacterium]